MTKPLVLIVEDDPTLRDLGRRQLAKLGYESMQVESGEEALQLDRQAVGLIFMDIGLPGMDGMKASMLIREQELVKQAKRVPIVALTGHGNRERVMSGMGIDDFLQKPALMEDIKNVLDKWMLTETETDRAN